MRRPLILALIAVVPVGAQQFEVASVRPHVSDVTAPIMKHPGLTDILVSGNRVQLRAVTLKELVVGAYGVKDYQVAGGPGWATSIGSMFDVDAKAPGDAMPTTAQLERMLQALLADRFQLKVRRESRRLPVYNLVTAKGGPKLKPVMAGAPAVPNTNRTSMEQITALWSLYMDRPVIDRTGIIGLFDFPIRLWQLDMDVKDATEVPAKALSSIQDDLGLRLESGRATIEMLVIESAEKPSAN